MLSIFNLHIFIFSILLNFLIKCELICAPDHFLFEDYYWSFKDYRDTTEYLKGFQYNKILNSQYTDYWQGVLYAPENFCYLSYDHNNIPESLSNLDIEEIEVIYSNETNTTNKYIKIEKNSTNLKDFYKNVCMSNKSKTENYEILFTFNEQIDKKTNFILYFSIINPSSEEISYQFFTHTLEEYEEEEENSTTINYLYDDIYYELTNSLTIQPNSAEIIKFNLNIQNKERFTTRNSKSFDHSKIIAKNFSNSASNKYFYYENGYENFDLFKVFTNFEIILRSNNSLGVSSHSLMFERPSSSYVKYTGTGKSCTNNQTCAEGYGCVSNNCETCNGLTCMRCTGNRNQCSQCYLISMKEQFNILDNSANNFLCNLEYVDLTKFTMTLTKLTIDSKSVGQVPPAINYRITMEFWMYVQYPIDISNVNLNIIYKDFMAITLTPNGEHSMDIYCVPLEWIYTYPDDPTKITTNIKRFLTDELGAYYVNDTATNISSRWFYTKCAYNIESNKMLLNKYEFDLKIPQLYNGQTNFPFQMKKFYKKNQYTDLLFQNFNKADKTYIYLRNLNIYREYMPNTVETKYFNMHKLNNYILFPQLLYSIPFDEVIHTSASDSTFKFKTYNYYNRDNTTGVIASSVVIIDNNTLVFNRSNSQRKTNLKPPKNFQRLNLLDINKQASNCDYQTLIDIKCEDSKNLSFCFDDNLPFACKSGTDALPYFLDINNLTCNTYCPRNYMMSSRDSPSILRQYCNRHCDENELQCASEQSFYNNIQYGFICMNGFFNLYYKCYSESDTLNDRANNAVYFGNFLNSHTIYINLNNVYKSYIISVWIFPEMRLRNKRYDTEWNYLDLDKISDYTLFYTDHLRVKIGSSSYSYGNVVVHKNGNNLRTLSTSERFNIFNWNRLFIVVDKDKESNNSPKFYATFQNSIYYNDLRYTTITGEATLKEIVFCQNDKDFQFIGSSKSDCDKINWYDAYYYKLQIWDIQDSNRKSIYYAYHFDDKNNFMLRHQYFVKLSNIIENTITDEINGQNGYLPIIKDNIVQSNPDNINYINYASNFYPQTALSGENGTYTTSYSFIGSVVRISNSSTTDECAIASSSSICLKCKEKYALYKAKCNAVDELIEKGNDTQNTSFYYYKNPGINQPSTLSLNIDSSVLEGKDYLTIFFFLKLYGFTVDVKNNEEARKIIILDNTPDSTLYLAYDPSDDIESLYFYHNGIRIFEYFDFRYDNFGLWVPISLSMFREYDRTFTLNMASCSIGNYHIPFNFQSGTEFPTLYIRQFTITNTWVGLISDVKIYEKFYINPWGVFKFGWLTDLALEPIYDFNLKSIDSNNCLKSSDLLISPGNTFKFECVTDYNYNWKKCPTQSSNYFHSEWGEGDLSYYTICGGSCGSHLPPVRCLGSPGGGNIETQSCENVDLEWRNWHLYLSSSGSYNVPERFSSNNYQFIQCLDIEEIDFARFKYAKLNDIISPPILWNIDFWFYTDSFRNVYNTYISPNTTSRGTLRDYKKVNFKNFVLEWDFHLRIIIEAQKDSIDPAENDYTYYATCVPLIVLDNHSLDSKESKNISLGYRQAYWQYISCGINYSNKTFFITNTNVLKNEASFNPLTEVSLTKLSSFVLTENSPNGYGITFIREIRLWKCYSCSLSYRNYDFDIVDTFITEIIHCFQGRIGGGGDKRIFKDYMSNTKDEYFMSSVPDFKGYNILYDYYLYTRCDEKYFEYYNEELDICERQFNLARALDIELTVPSSRTGRYTMEFWFFVETPIQLTSGVNFYWQKHLSITLIRPDSNNNNTNVICFPQAYRDNVDGLSGLEIYNLIDSAINVASYTKIQSGNKWLFVRCAVDQTRKIYYINDDNDIDDYSEVHPYKTLEPEYLYDKITNYRPFRYFDIERSSRLKIQNIRNNNSRFFLRQLRLFREFIDMAIDKIKFIKFDTYVNEWFMLAYIDFIDSTFSCDKDYNCFTCYTSSTCGIYYGIHYENQSATFNYEKTWLRDNKVLTYTTYPSDLYVYKFCGGSQGGGGKEDCTGEVKNYFYYDSTTEYFYPSYNGVFIDLSNRRQVTQCSDTYKSCRLPDSLYNRAYCLFNPGDNNMIDCPTQVSGNSYNSYTANFICNTGYTKVYYECVDDSLLTNSAMYFSNYFSFPNLHFEAADNTNENGYPESANDESDKRLISYYIELWFKLDAINHNGKITDNEIYLYIFPHVILKDSTDQIFKYANELISSGNLYYSLSSISPYEWNRIIIENKYDFENKDFTIKFYTNYNFDSPEFVISNLVASTYKMHFRGIGFCNTKFSDCIVNNDPKYLHWGVAWYRNLRIWDERITSLELIQSCGIGYKEFIYSQKYYWPLTANTIEKNTIVDLIGEYKLTHNWWYYGNNYDNEIRQNWSTENFDYTGINFNNFITGLNSNEDGYLLSECNTACKRCYSADISNCYECNEGYQLYGKKCQTITGFYLKTPPENDDASEIKLKTVFNEINYDLSKVNPLTFTIWIKYLGIELNSYNNRIANNKLLSDSDKNYYFPLIYLYNKQTFIAFNIQTKKISLVLHNENITTPVEAYNIPSKKIIAVWAHFGFSLYRSKSTTEYKYFPNMFNFFIDTEYLSPLNSFNPTTKKVFVNNIIFDTIPIAYYSDIRIYNNFYFAPYGHINGISMTRGVDLLYEYTLKSNTESGCLYASLLDASSSNVQITCIKDYHPFEDSVNVCSADNYTIDISLSDVPPCLQCNSYCTNTNCFNSGIENCTCEFYNGLYWVQSNNVYSKYNCQKVDSINFAFYERMDFNNLNVSNNDEIAMHFWLYVYEYKNKNFDNIDINWGEHVRIIIANNNLTGTNKKLMITCYPDPKYEDISYYPADSITKTVNFNTWNYIRCAVDRFHLKFKLNGGDESSFSLTHNILSSTSSLYIVDNTNNFNYGFSFIRELKLYSSYTFSFWDDSNQYVNSSNFGYLLHYFDNSFNDSNLNIKMMDKINSVNYVMTVKSNRIGYNYVIDYSGINICNEGYLYNKNSGVCETISGLNCSIARDDNSKCLKCVNSRKYLSAFDTCVSDCSPNYYNDDYLSQCRPCDETCYTCTDKYYNNCTSCTGVYYLVESLNICVLNCEEYGLTAQVDVPNLCGPFKAHANITSPVHLTDYYDYDESNSDYKEKIINLKYFNSITAVVYNNTASGFQTKWKYSLSDTKEYNKNYRNYDEHDLAIDNEDNFFTSDTSDLTVDINNSYLKYGYKYIIYLLISMVNGDSMTTVELKYILIINDYPEINKFLTLPIRGYTSTTFLFTCNECTDDYTSHSNLQYKFTYTDSISNIVEGFDTNENEIIINDWSNKSEVLKIFSEVNTQNGEENLYKYYVKCYCRDSYYLYNSTYKTINVYLPPDKGGETVPISESIVLLELNNSLTSEQLSNRAEYLYTLTVDYPKDYILNRTNITNYDYNTGKSISYLQIQDPKPKLNDSYCNYHGNSYVEYKYLICDCINYFGEYCQIDGDAFSQLINIYQTIYDLVLNAQTTTYDNYLINTIHLLIKSGSEFMEIDNMNFMLNSMEFITLYTSNFEDDLLENENYKIYFDIYNSLIEYGLHIINRLKLKNFIELNSIIPNSGMYDINNIRNATITKEQNSTILYYFKEIKNNLENLLKFYSDNKFELSFINKNINVYIAILNENFNFTSYFEKETKIYQPYFIPNDCISYVMKTTNNQATFKTILNVIVWKINPYMPDINLYWNNTSPLITMLLLDYYTLKKIYLNDCGKNEIKFYFPFNNYLLIDIVNDKKDYIAPYNQIDSNDGLFNDPVYIDKEGKVYNTTPEERQAKYFVPFNFTCKYYYINNDDNNSISFRTIDVDYNDYTNDNYILCKTNSLLQNDYSEFIVEYVPYDGNFHINSRFFYLKKIQLLKYSPNYKTNSIFYYFIIIISAYFILLVTYSACNKLALQSSELLSFIENTVIKINLPYRDDYDFNIDDLAIDNELKDKLNVKRKNPDLIEQRKDINDVDANVMADNISRYYKDYKDKSNKLRERNEFFDNNDNNNVHEQLSRNKNKFFNGANSLESMDTNNVLKVSNDNNNNNINNIIDNKYSNFFNQEFNKKNSDDDNNKITNKSHVLSEHSDFDSYKDLIVRKSNQNKKFFNEGSNPPKKKVTSTSTKNNNMIANPELNLNLKDPKKNLKFFDITDKEKHYKKRKNLFQDQFDDVYVPHFDPKIVSEKLNFYEKSKNNRNIYYEKLQDYDKKGLGENVNMDTHLKQNPSEIDLIRKEKEKLPKLLINLTYEVRLLEYYYLSLSAFNFFKKNIKNRYIILTSFSKFNLCYERYKRLGNLISQMCLYAFFLSLFYTMDANQEILNKKKGNEVFLFILYCFLSEIFSCILIHLPSFMFYFDIKKFRKIYHFIRENKGLDIMKNFDEIIKNNIWWNILGVFVQWVYIIISFYFSFGFYCTYEYQRKTFFLGVIITLISDILFWEFVWEGIIAFLYSLKECGRFIVMLGEFFNRMRNMKQLV